MLFSNTLLTLLHASAASTTPFVAPPPPSTTATAGTQETSIPSVIVTVENLQPSQGAFLTPPWVGIHDGSFDTHDVGAVAQAPLGGDELERLAEDGNTMPLSTTFTTLSGGAPQVPALAAPNGGPLAPGDTAAATLNIDPLEDRYLSYATMVIPSNDTFLANDDPVAHPLFGARGTFLAPAAVASGDDAKDAGTEQNDEIATNVAFLAQAAPDTGVAEAGVVSLNAGFDSDSLTYPNGVLNHPAFAQAGFQTGDPPMFRITTRFVDLGRTVIFGSRLTPGQEIQSTAVHTAGLGVARLTSEDAQSLTVQAQFLGLSGPLVGAHLHLAQAGSNGPIVVDLDPGIGPSSVIFTATAADLTGPLAGQSLLALLNELAAGNVYLNLHTAAFPAGEIRGQVELRGAKDGR